MYHRYVLWFWGECVEMREWEANPGISPSNIDSVDCSKLTSTSSRQHVTEVTERCNNLQDVLPCRYFMYWASIYRSGLPQASWAFVLRISCQPSFDATAFLMYPVGAARAINRVTSDSFAANSTWEFARVFEHIHVLARCHDLGLRHVEPKALVLHSLLPSQ